MKILGMDVCTGFCSVAIVEDGALLASQHEPMTRGHAERLAPMVAEVLAEARLAASDLNAIAVTTGPGSFTGARLGVSFARGLALAVDIPAIGVSVFEAMTQDDNTLIALPGKQGSVLVQLGPMGAPVELSAETAWSAAPASGPVSLIGPAAETIIEAAPEAFTQRAMVVPTVLITAETIAIIGAKKRASGISERPAPLYLRPPDAKPQATVVLT
jgi:tRNA threonylcarbamoyladenosine biosynthesis protein TsaB